MRKIGLFMLWLFFLSFSLQAQETEKKKLSFSMQEARDFALKNSYILKNAESDVKVAKKKVWETTAQGLPQADASAAYTYMIEVPAAIEQFAGMGDLIEQLMKSAGAPNADDPSGAGQGTTGGTGSESSASKVNIDDIRYTATMDIKVTQLIFSGPYLVGLQASKTYRNISRMLLTKTKDDVLETVTNSYVLVLVARENRRILEGTLTNLQSTLGEIEAMYKEGFVEDIEVDQLRLSVQNVNNSLSMLKRQEKIAEQLLKFQMGLDITAPVELTDNLDDLVAGMTFSAMADNPFDVTSNINYKLVENQEKMAKLNWKLRKTEYLPTIAAFYNHQENFNDKAFNMNPSDVVGLSVSLPIFSSGMRKSRLGQAKIEYLKAQNDKQKAEEGLKLEYSQTKTEYITAWDKYVNDRKSMELGNKIYSKTLIKYKEGVSSSLDLTQTQNQYLQTQSNYFNSVMELFKAGNKLEKILKKN